MKTNAALLFQVAISLVAACILVILPGVARAQSVPSERAVREVLSIGWQAGYCAARPKSRGCAGFSSSSEAASRFSLVGRFQVRKSYCGIDADLAQKARKGKWTDLPEITVASATRDRLIAAMPAARDGFDRRQWLKSGTCVAASPDAYFSRSLDLLDEINASPVRAIFERKAGAEITLDEVRAAFDAAFGAGTGDRVRLACRKTDGGAIVTGLTIGITAGEGKLATPVEGARPTKSRCTGGVTGMPQSARAALQ